MTYGADKLPKFINTLHALNGEQLADALLQDIRSSGYHCLPLQQGLVNGSHVIEDGLQLMLLDTSDAGDYLVARAGVFYQSVIGGCNCADDPSPVEPLQEYCELEFDIDRQTGATTIHLVGEN